MEGGEQVLHQNSARDVQFWLDLARESAKECQFDVALEFTKLAREKREEINLKILREIWRLYQLVHGKPWITANPDEWPPATNPGNNPNIAYRHSRYEYFKRQWRISEFELPDRIIAASEEFEKEKKSHQQELAKVRKHLDEARRALKQCNPQRAEQHLTPLKDGEYFKNWLSSGYKVGPDEFECWGWMEEPFNRLWRKCQNRLHDSQWQRGADTLRAKDLYDKAYELIKTHQYQEARKNMHLIRGILRRNRPAGCLDRNVVEGYYNDLRWLIEAQQASADTSVSFSGGHQQGEPGEEESSTEDHKDIDNDEDGYTENEGDCDDKNPAVNPDAKEICGDGRDNDCDDRQDEGCRKYYRDADGDGFGRAGTFKLAMSVPLGYAVRKNDCNDADSSIHPRAQEVCEDGQDNDCDGRTDERQCSCPRGMAWNRAKTKCIDARQAAVEKADPICAVRWPGSVAKWNEKSNRPECVCPKGKAWNKSKSECIDSIQAVLQRTDCSRWPNSIPVWNRQKRRPECGCPKGMAWNRQRTKCVDFRQAEVEKAQQVCTRRWPGSVAKWNSQLRRVQCVCPPGTVLNRSKTACINKRAPQEALSFEGQRFALGQRAFADRVEAFRKGKDSAESYADPRNALGTPGKGSGHSRRFTALGHRGSLIVSFSSAWLVDHRGADIYVFETGPATEPFRVEISRDGRNWIDLGEVSGQPTRLDIAGKGPPGEKYRYVRLTDAGSGKSPHPYAGADIDAIGAINAVRATRTR
jgi:hypothetical protein